MKNVVQIRANLVWKWGRTKSGNYIAVCDPISQTVLADKFSDLVNAIQEALNSTFNELLSSGDIEQFLTDQGWKAANLPESSRRQVRFDVPFNLLQRGGARRDCEAAVCS